MIHNFSKLNLTSCLWNIPLLIRKMDLFEFATVRHFYTERYVQHRDKLKDVSMKTCILSLMLFIVIGCSDFGVTVPPDIPINQLLASPDTITVEGRKLYLSTYMWRDFQPISPPNGKPLIAIIYVTATDTAKLPNSISADAVWIVFNNQVWKSWFTNEQIASSELRPNRIVKIAREGPKWGPHVNVDVIVRVLDGRGNIHLLRAPDQRIGRTD